MKKRFFILTAVAALMLVTFFGCTNNTKTRYTAPRTSINRSTSSSVYNYRTTPGNGLNDGVNRDGTTRNNGTRSYNGTTRNNGTRAYDGTSSMMQQYTPNNSTRNRTNMPRTSSSAPAATARAR